MSSAFKAVVLFTVAAVLCAATFILVPRLRRAAEVDPGGIELANNEADDPEPEQDSPVSREKPSTRNSREYSSLNSLEIRSDREKNQFDVGEMRHEVEELLRKFRGTPEERQEVIEECENGKELIQLFGDLSESSIEKMSPEELEKEREDFEKEYRAQLDFLQTGQLQQMLKTPEEEEIIGSTIEAIREFLEQIDSALNSVGY